MKIILILILVVFFSVSVWSAGLEDFHTHLLLVDETYDHDFDLSMRKMNQMSEEARLAIGIKNAESLYRAGFDRVRDLGNSGQWLDLKLKKLIEAKMVKGPKMQISGPGIATLNGQFKVTTPLEEVQKEYRIINHASEADAIVNEYKKKGADWIKIYLDNLPGEGQMSEAVASALVKAAHQSGLPVAAHAILLSSIDLAIKLGVDSIEHAPEILRVQMEGIKKKNIILVPTDLPKSLWSLFDKENVNMGPRRARLTLAKELKVALRFGSDLYYPVAGRDRGELTKESFEQKGF